MSQITNANPYLELKQRTNRDVRQLGPLVSQYYEADSTANQTVINLSFSVEQTTEGKKQVQLYIDGNLLREGAANDYLYTSVASGQSSQITLNTAIIAGLNIMAYKIGAVIQNFPNPSSVQATLNTDVNQPHLMAQNGFQSFIKQLTVAAPNTTIVNRAQIIDELSTLKAIAGVERIHANNIVLLTNEFGSAGQTVYELENKDKRIRLVGFWSVLSDTNGGRPATTTVNDFVEVTFYGTGLNLISSYATSVDIRATVDTNAEGSNLITATSSVINARNYRTNMVVPVTSGLTLGYHTVKLRNNNTAGFNFLGIEVLNERSTIGVLPGTAYAGAKQELLVTTSSTSFSAGITGTKGGRVVKYIKDGVISQVVQEVNASAAYLTSADHTNEELVKKINFREFGANRADDFSNGLTTGATSNNAFTLDDGSTTFVGSTVQLSTNSNGVRINNTGGAAFFMTITFTGTGLDIYTVPEGAGTTTNFTLVVDGTSQGSISTTYASASDLKLVKLASGLAYGTHTIKLALASPGSAVNFGIADIFIYQPKKPTLPTDAIEICDYNVLPTYVASSSGAIGAVSIGTIRELSTRGITYAGTWISPSVDVISFDSGFNIRTTTSGSFLEYTFYGTGAEIRTVFNTGDVYNATISVDGSSNLSTFSTSLVSTTTGLTLNTTTGVLSGTVGSGTAGFIKIAGLTLGKHTIRVTTNNSTTILYANAFDVITPIHINSSSLKIGSLSLKSNRNFSPVTDKPTQIDLGKAKAWCKYDTATGAILGGSNIAAILSTATGIFNVYFEKPFKNNNYTVVGSASATRLFTSSGFQNNYAVISVQNSTTAAFESAVPVSFVVFGELADENDLYP